MRQSKLLSCVLMVTMVANLNILTITSVIAGVSLLYSNSVFADPEPETNTPKLKQLQDKYFLNNPTRNHQSDTLSTNVQSQLATAGPGRNLTPIIVNTLSAPSVPRTIDLSNYFDPANPETFNKHRDLAVNLSGSHGAPSGDTTGDTLNSVNLEYARSGTRRFVRDADGKLVIQVIEGVERVSGANANDLFSNEHSAGHPGYSFEANKQGLYGDEEGIFDEGRAAHTNFKDPETGKTSAGRGYRAITAGAYRAIAEPSPLAMLEQSFTHLANTQDPNLWLTSCTTQTIPSSSTFTSTSSREHFCQDTNQSNFDFCEVERDIRIPVYSSTPGLRSCGAGCYEFDLNIDVWKTSRCRSTAGGDGTAAVFTLNLNLGEGIAIKDVKITGTAADHFLYTLNGQKLWESTGLSQSGSGNYLSGSCNISGHTHQIDTNVTSRVNSIVGPLATEGVYALTFRGDLRWKRNGNMTSTVRFEIEDTSGNGLATTFTQYPEGCYDALSLEDKLLRGLEGVYDWDELGIDPNLPALRYQCVSSPRQPLCLPGETVFGSAGQEQCYATPEPPVCSAGTFNSATERCEYAATISCPSIAGVSCGTDGLGNQMFPVAPIANLIGLACTYTDAEHCGTGWSYELPASISCPNGGVSEGSLCVIETDTSNMCDTANGYSLTTVMIGGVESQRCERPVENYQENTWTCDTLNGEVQTYSPAYCSVTYEEFRDEDGNPIPTIDEDGFPIFPPFLDDEGQPIEFSDVANCVKPQLPPDVDPVDIPQSFCTFDSYDIMDEGARGFPAELLADIPPFFSGDTGNKTWKVNLNKYRCDPTQGRIMCFPDADTGEEVCYDWEDLKNLPDRCARFKDDATCSEVERDCTEGWLEPITGRCMAYTVTYRCDNNTAIDYNTSIDVNTCESMIPCVGGDCEIGGREQNDRFVEAMVAGSILDNIQGDSSCQDPTDQTTCRIFEGEYKYCSWETSGLGTDCCEEAKGVDIIGYIVFTRQMLKVNQMAYSGAFGSGIEGSYKTLSQPITSAYDAIAQWGSDAVRTATESIFGNAGATTASGTVSAATEGITAALSAVQQQVYSFIYNMLPDTLAQLIFTEVAANAATNEAAKLVMNKTLENMLSNVMAIYAVYSLAKLALTLLTACDEHEMDMGVKLAQRQCFKVGPRYCNKTLPALGGLGACMQRRQDYCCYSSILARIVMKEAYNQLSINPLPYGTKLHASSPEAAESCLGLNPDQLAMLDFNAPSMQTALQEWIGLLLEAGEIPTESSEQSLTGGATTVDRSCPPQLKPVLSCYIDPITTDEICDHARDLAGNLLYEEIPTECVKELTPGQIWNAEDRQTASERIYGADGYIHGAQDRVLEGKQQIKNIIGTLDCSILPRPPLCRFAFDPLDD